MRPTLLQSLILLVTILYAKLLLRMEHAYYWAEDLFIYDGKAGQVAFNCEEEEADGVVRCRSIDDYGRPTVTALNFRLSNRWPVSARRRLSGLILLDILSQANLAGLHPIDLHWLQPACLRWTATRLDPRIIERNERLARRSARRARLHRWLARWFPSPPPRSYDPRDHRDMIIKRM